MIDLDLGRTSVGAVDTTRRESVRVRECAGRIKEARHARNAAARPPVLLDQQDRKRIRHMRAVVGSRVASRQWTSTSSGRLLTLAGPLAFTIITDNEYRSELTIHSTEVGFQLFSPLSIWDAGLVNY